MSNDAEVALFVENLFMQPEATELEHLALHRSWEFQILLLNLGWHLLGLQLHCRRKNSPWSYPTARTSLSLYRALSQTPSPLTVLH